jgi:hypothetical protein
MTTCRKFLETNAAIAGALKSHSAAVERRRSKIFELRKALELVCILNPVWQARFS